jgi:tetratricopeptide (TPR) repeat protein
VLDMVHSMIKGMRTETYLAARRVAAMEPRSEWLIDLASAATFANRPREGLAASRAISQDHPIRLTPDWSGWKYWRLVGGAHHMLEDYESQLRTVDEGRAAFGDPEKSLVEVHLSALAGLGRVEEALRVADSASTAPERPNGFPIFLSLETGAQELEAHGFPEAAREMRRRVEALNERILNERPSRFMALSLEAYRSYNRGDWARARAYYDSIISFQDSSSRVSGQTPSVVVRLRYQGRRGFVAARMGDRKAASETSQWMAALSERFLYGQNTMWRARIAASLGDKKEAVDLIRQAIGEGEAYGWHLHRDRELVLLRGYPPFEALLRPVN